MTPKVAEKKKAAGKVVDLGGAFIYSENPKVLAQWYIDVLGVPLEYSAEEGNYYFVFVHKGDSGAEAYTVFSIKPAKGKLAKPRNQFMINFTIDDYDGFVKRLKAQGVALDRSLDCDYGRFGWIKDLEGNPVEFWQPKP